MLAGTKEPIFIGRGEVRSTDRMEVDPTCSEDRRARPFVDREQSQVRGIWGELSRVAAHPFQNSKPRPSAAATIFCRYAAETARCHAHFFEPS